MRKWYLKKGDQVKVICGKDKGKVGKIIRTIKEEDRVLVEKINLVKKHKKPDQKNKGGIVEKEAGLHVSNVLFLCGKCNRPARIKIKALASGTRARVCQKCQENLDAQVG